VGGAAPATRETDLLRPENKIDRVHAVCLAGCSAFGLAAADGVMSWLAERDIGYHTHIGVVPLVPAAALLDASLADPARRPSARAGWLACEHASDRPVEEGSVGAGTGATIGKVLGLAGAVKGGVGSYAIRVGDNFCVGALVVVNAVGDVVDPATGHIVAGARGMHSQWVDATAWLLERTAAPEVDAGNTTLVVVATDAPLATSQATHLARVAHDGLARAVRPAHTQFDGDVAFALSTAPSGRPVDAHTLTALGVASAEVVGRAIVRAVLAAHSLGDIPALRDLDTRRDGSSHG
jgi:L-aminopeptidase/D-esterase-like protein